MRDTLGNSGWTDRIMQPIITQKQNIDSKSNLLDDSYTRTSPCLSCKRLYQDKNVCVETCQRMSAYRDNEPYDHLPCVVVPELYTKYPKCLIPGCKNEGNVRGLCAHDHYVK